MFLCLISIVEVFSASSTLTYRNANYWGPIMRHTTFLLAGTGIVLLVHSFPPKYFSVLIFLLPVSIILLVITKIMGAAVNGAERWLSIGGLSFQPSELAKLSLIAYVSFILSKKQDSPNDKSFRWILTGSVITCGIIFLDNFSTASILFSIVCMMMFIGQIPLKHLAKLGLALVLSGILFIVALMFIPSNTFEKIKLNRAITWKERILDFTHRDNSTAANDSTFRITDDNLQVSHAKIAVANGKIFGKLPGNSQQRDFLPQAYSDFIYAIIIEELGIVGGIFVLFLYVALFIRAGIIANRCEKIFPKFLVIGSSLILVTQALANMAVAVNLIPVTGQPLPLVSRGGTSTLITCIYFGILLSVSRFENPKGIKKEEEIRNDRDEEEIPEHVHHNYHAHHEEHRILQHNTLNEITHEEES